MKFDGFKINPQWDEAAHAAVAEDDEKDWEVFTHVVTRQGADALLQSNFNFLQKELLKVDPEKKAHKVIYHRHWTVRYYEYVIFDPKNKEVVARLNEIKRAKLKGLSTILDEEGYLQLQLEYGELDTESDSSCPDNSEDED